MTDAIRKELLDVPDSYPADNLHSTYYHALSPHTRNALADRLTRFLQPLRLAGSRLTDDEKARLLYETLSRCLRYDHTDQDQADPLRYTYAGGILSGKAVCMGIAELYTLLGTALGLRVETIIGYGGDPGRAGGLHAWNLVWLTDGGIPRAYHCDLTWDLSESADLLGFRYYLKSDGYMRCHDHTWLSERYPVCPRNRAPAQIPHIPPAAVSFLCRQFNNIRNF